MEKWRRGEVSSEQEQIGDMEEKKGELGGEGGSCRLLLELNSSDFIQHYRRKSEFKLSKRNKN